MAVIFPDPDINLAVMSIFTSIGKQLLGDPVKMEHKFIGQVGKMSGHVKFNRHSRQPVKINTHARDQFTKGERLDHRPVHAMGYLAEALPQLLNS